MKKLLLTLLITATAYVGCMAQIIDAPYLSLGLDAGLPTGTASQVYSSVIGASAQLELRTNNSHLKFMLTAGYSDFLIKSEYSDIFTSASYLQIEPGARYYFVPMIYIEGDFGLSVNLNQNYTEQKVGLAYDPTIGFNLPIDRNNAIDIGLRYDGRVESGGTISQVALRVAYKINL